MSKVPFQEAADRIQGIHVEKDMTHGAMQENRRDEAPDLPGIDRFINACAK